MNQGIHYFIPLIQSMINQTYIASGRLVTSVTKLFLERCTRHIFLTAYDRTQL